MKLRFRSNSLRLRVNQKEVQTLMSGQPLREQVVFPGSGTLAYVLEAGNATTPAASFAYGTIRIQAPRTAITEWAEGEDIGMYFDFPADGTRLKVSIEKDLECIDGPPGEVDLDAFPRASNKPAMC